MKKIFIGLLVILFGFEANAVGVWYFEVSLKDVRAQNKSGQTSFRTIEAVNNPASCGNAGYYGVRPEHNPELAMSILLAAYISGKN